MIRSSFPMPNRPRRRREPGMAAVLSLVSGLGQIYNGQRRKGYLFLAVLVVNVQTIIWCAFNGRILSQLHISAAHLQAIIYGVAVFTIYAMWDAYLCAAAKRGDAIAASSSLEMCEAASLSFLIHYVVFALILLIVCFILKPVAHHNQETKIIFISKQIVTKEKVHADARSSSSSKRSGEHRSKPIVTPASSSSPASAQRSFAPPSVKPLPRTVSRQLTESVVPPTPRTISTRVPALVQPLRLPEVHRVSVERSLVRLPEIRPTASTAHLKADAFTPQPLKQIGTTPIAVTGPKPTFSRGQNPSAVPAPQIGGSLPGNAPLPVGPVPVNPNSETPGQNMVPNMMHSRSVPSSETGNRNTGPSPTKVPGSNVPTVAVMPQFPGTGMKAGEGLNDHSVGNPPANSNPHAPPSEAAEGADFGPYMAELQRRIRRAWFPAKDYQSLRVVVIFRISKTGELSKLTVKQSSGKAVADQTALQAVENAAPFPHLPKGSDDSVDVQFTFDYNVFSGGGNLLRNF